MAPTITSNPLSQTVTAGLPATFSVNAAGTSPINYQWYENGAVISGANSASYTTVATSGADNGASFQCVVSNSAGSATSTTAMLSVIVPNSPPVIDSAPSVTPASPIAGQATTLTVGASDPDDDALSYTWDFGDNTTGLGASVSHTYASAGQFSAIVTVTDGRGGSVSSSTAVTVIQPAGLKDMLISQIGITGAKMTGGYRANVQIHVVNGGGMAVPGARVYVMWSGATTGTTSKLTNSTGVVSFVSTKSVAGGTFTIAVTNVKKTGYTYRPGLNAVTSASATKP